MRARLPVVLLAAAALALTGLSPVSARDLDARVLDIAERVRADVDGDRAQIRFAYRCTGDDDDITTTVILWQDGNRLDRSFSGGLACDGGSRWTTVTVHARHDQVETGRAYATVKVDAARGARLDRVQEWVRVYRSFGWTRR